MIEPMTRVSWETTGPDDIEAVAAMFLFRAHPNSLRIRASTGDGGIDILHPLGHKLFDIYQVKSFNSNLTRSQKSKIEGSLIKVRDYAQSRGWNIRHWHLTLPLDPTKENYSFLETLTDKYKIDCKWKGRTQLDSWAAEYPEIVDYYLHSGKGRLEESMQEMARAFRSLSAQISGSQSRDSHTGDPLNPTEAVEYIRSMCQQVNRYDPFYSFGFHSSPTEPTTLQISPKAAAAYMTHTDDLYNWIEIIPKCRESLRLQPLQVRFTFPGDLNGENIKRMDDFKTYGIGISKPIPALFDATLPGGLSFSSEPAIVSIQPSNDSNPQRIRAAIVDPAENELTSATLVRLEATRSPYHTGHHIRYREANGVFELREKSRYISEEITETQIVITPLDHSGSLPDEIVNGLKFLATFNHPNTLIMKDIRGSRIIRKVALPVNEAEILELSQTIAEVCAKLAAIQEACPEIITVPPAFESRELQDIYKYHKILHDKHVKSNWDQGKFHIDAEVDEDLLKKTVKEIIYVTPATLILQGKRYQLGYLYSYIESAIANQIQPGERENVLDVTYVPFGNSTLHQTWLPDLKSVGPLKLNRVYAKDKFSLIDP